MLRRRTRIASGKPYGRSFVRIVKRLTVIDSLLAGDGLFVMAAAEQLGVSDKSIRRRLSILRQLAGPTVCDIDETTGRYRHRYAKGVKPLFTASLNRKRR